MNTTEIETYTVGISSAGTTHTKRNPSNYQADCMYGSWNRGRIGSLRKVEKGSTPSGILCKKCFPEDGDR